MHFVLMVVVTLVVMCFSPGVLLIVNFMPNRSQTL